MPDLGKLTGLLSEVPAFGQMAEILGQGNGASLTLPDAAKPFVLAAIHQRLGRPVLVITAQPKEARDLQEQLAHWCGPTPVRLMPEPDTLPYEHVVPDASIELERVQVLSTLAGLQDDKEEAFLAVASAPALMMKTSPVNEFTAQKHTVKPGMETDPFDLLAKWQSIGYQMETVVELPGTISHRGGIVDIFPPTSELPVRLEFFGNTVERLTLFDPASQRSVKEVNSVLVGPATEVLSPLLANKEKLEKHLNSLDLSGCTEAVKEEYRHDIGLMLEHQKPLDLRFYAPLFQTGGLLDYLPRQALLVLDGLDNIQQAIADLAREAVDLREGKLRDGDLPRNFPKPYFDWEEIEPRLKAGARLCLTPWGTAEEASYQLGFNTAPRYTGQWPSFVKKLKQRLGQRSRVIITSQQASRLAELLDEEGMAASPVTEIAELPPSGSVTLVQGSLGEGWTLDSTHLFTDTELFGFTKQRRLVKKRLVAHHKLLTEITPGDFVVHIEHGIAKFAGVGRMGSNGNEKEYLILQYGGGDRLYVPSDQIGRVNRYIGAGDQPPVLSRLGTQEWVHTRQKVKESVAQMAKELLTLYASRQVVPGHAFPDDTVWQQELEGSFPYVETPDQLRVVQEVKADMMQPRPMDRLVCGDVGYGKTEVAIRAAFKAVMDNKQVAVLVPTTVLAQQHFMTFSQRMAAFPVKVEMLSRFRTPKEQQTVIEGLASGTVDICIGTHRLLQKDVVFKDLGLLIIDEEQRFGVAHKEHLKKMRREVDVLTLSATPIPRTLHMSLVGVRDMSTMETPPEERLPIKTYVAEFSDRLVREAVLRELEHNGQVFFVHNRVQSIAFIAGKLQSIVPEARIAIAHGQMPEMALERVMADFAQGKSDILVCTTIIESGLDMPNVNTLIVHQADRFGLTQLYQLRGRVGRGAELAYAYFLYDKGKRLTPTAQKRLKTIFEATELGAGFSIAMKDLEIRGAGTLLGAKQSGHISAVGFSLYTKLLAEAVEEEKARLAGTPEKVTRALPQPSIDLPLPAYIPEDYVEDVDSRLALYQKMVSLDRNEQIEAMAQEFSDRFGPLPKEVHNLLYTIRMKVMAAKAGVESISTEDGQIVLRRFEGLPFDRKRLEPLLKDGVRVGNTQLSFSHQRARRDWRHVLEDVLGRVSK